MRIVIETTDNGAILSTDDQNGEDVRFSYDLETHLGEDDREKQAQLLYQLVELLGWMGSRHDEKRIRINIEPGDKYEPVA